MFVIILTVLPLRMKYFIHCVAGGICAAFAGISAKMMTSDSFSIMTVACLLSLIVFNVGMWVNYTTAMQGMRTVTATSATTTVNFVVSGIAGYLLFGEVLSLYWCIGLSLIILGVILLNSEQTEDKDKQE